MSDPDAIEPPAKMLSKVRAMLAKAENEAATRAESETYFAKAMELMAKYGITQTLLDAGRPDGLTIADRIFDVLGPYAMGKAILLYHVGEALGGRAIRIGKGVGGTVRIHLFGTAADIERTEMMFTSLLLQLHRFAALDASRHPLAHRNPRKWHGDYIRGFTVTVAERIRQAEARAKQQASSGSSGPSVALVLVQRSELINNAFTEAYPKTRKGTGVAVGAGFDSGVEGGRRADIGGTRLGDGSQRALPQSPR